ncbi:MAG: urease subunit beta [Thermomicrobiales bacterium]
MHGGSSGAPGALILADDPIEINAGRRSCSLTVRNTGDRAIQIGSHFHFFEVNRALDFDRPRAIGMRLDIAAGTSIRFEPGQERQIGLVAIGGARDAIGFNGLVMGSVDAKRTIAEALARAVERGFMASPEPSSSEGGHPHANGDRR